MTPPAGIGRGDRSGAGFTRETRVILSISLSERVPLRAPRGRLFPRDRHRLALLAHMEDEDARALLGAEVAADHGGPGGVPGVS